MDALSAMPRVTIRNMPSEPTQPTLEYGHQGSLAWAGRHRRKLILLAILLAIAGPIAWYFKPLKHRALWLYWSHRAATHPMPWALPAITSDPTEIARLGSNPEYVRHV